MGLPRIHTFDHKRNYTSGLTPYIAATAFKPKPKPSGALWSDFWHIYVYTYVPLLSVFPVFFLVGWFVTRRYGASK